MIRSTFVIGLLATLLVSALPAGWAARQLAQSEARLQAAERTLAEIQTLAAQRRDLETTTADVAMGARPTDDIQTPLILTLEDLALERSLFRKIEEVEHRSLDEDAAASNGLDVRRQSMLVELKAAPLADVGRLLAAWRIRQPAWTPSRLTLTAARPARGRPGSTPPPPYALEMTLTSIYVDRTGDAP
ncbi:MAG: hypothetical protein AB8G96_09985 [Phycisphaerales bacterium]